MNIGDEVYLDDATGRIYGKVTKRGDNGLCLVKWDSGITERIHEDELSQNGGYEANDPKNPGWRERLAALWDNRRGK